LGSTNINENIIENASEEEEELLNVGEDEEWDNLIEDQEEEVCLVLAKVLQFMQRNPCLAHLIQLAIKDSLTLSEFVTKLIRRINEIVKFFHRRSSWYSKLRSQNGNVSLLLPCVTRWNSQYHSLKRIFGEKRKVKKCYKNGRDRCLIL
jgi:hypothetical protein